ncbi:MAG: FAD-dependent oxidoreductase [Vicinamibacterales bacterium]
MVRQVVLVGMGYAHLHVLRRWASHPPPDARLVCVTDTPAVIYSGMVPGLLAGEYAPSEALIDIGALTNAASAELHVASMTGIDRATRTVTLDRGQPVPFDVLSIAVGSQPSFEGVTIVDASRLVPHKPLASLLDRLERTWTEAQAGLHGRAPRLIVVGGGASGVELALCAPIYLRRISPDLQVTLLAGERGVLGDESPAASVRALRALTAAGVEVFSGLRVTGINGGTVTAAGGSSLVGEAILWATTSAPAPVINATDLPTGADGFPVTEHTLRVVGDARVFVAGDAGTFRGRRARKSGVVAVRQGPVLDANIRRVLADEPLVLFHQPRRMLRILNLGNGRSLAEWGPWSAEGRWVRRWKDHLDRRFMRRTAGPQRAGR